MGVPGGNSIMGLWRTSRQVQVGPLDCSGLNYASQNSYGCVEIEPLRRELTLKMASP